jgi:hypothetical protein
MGERLVRVEAPHFVAALVTVEGKCTEAAPILGWAIGKTEDELRAYFRRKAWKATEVRQPNGPRD